MSLREPKQPRIPTDEEYENYGGANLPVLWKEVGDSFDCSACGRTRREILKWSRRNFRRVVGKCAPFWGWLGLLAEHHDHGGDVGRRPRFPKTVICGQCDAADGTAKRKLKLPAYFSFSPR
jgi:hypothetical protein